MKSSLTDIGLSLPPVSYLMHRLNERNADIKAGYNGYRRGLPRNTEVLRRKGMIRDITLGQYYPGDSLIHRLDPRIKIITTIAYIAALFITDCP